jgi:hypothetical protein
VFTGTQIPLDQELETMSLIVRILFGLWAAQGLFYRNSGCGRGVYGWIRACYRVSPVGPKLMPAMGLPEDRLARIADRLGPACSIAANTQPRALFTWVWSGKRNIHGILVDVSA